MTDNPQAPWLRPDPALDTKFPAIGFAPCPGDLRTAERVAKIVRKTARALSDIAHVLNGTGCGEWRGKAAEAFREQFDEDFRPKVNDARDSFTTAATALEGWSRYMETRQKLAEQLEQEAQAALDRAGQAQRDLDGMPPKPGFADSLKERTPEEKAKQERLEATRSGREQSLHSANADLEEIRGRAHRLQQRYVEEGEAVAGRIQHAADIAPNEPGWLDKISEALGKLDDLIGKALDAALTEIKQFLKENAWLFKMIGDIAGTLGGLLGLVSLVVPWLAPVALALGAVAMVSHYLMAVGTTGSFTAALTDESFLIDAAGLAFGGGAFAAGKALTRVAGPGTAGLFKTALTQPGEVMGGAQLAASTLQFSGNWLGNSVAMLPGGTAKNTNDLAKFLLPGDQTQGPEEDGLPDFLNPEKAKEATR
ncbi:putative T7SS-secreted protein [Streptomyces albidoflavus]|uniref:putative T7SS-secreted protein n=1 Tax=Streptomyces albidoflavus TaxID=1886 RepID=UPI00331D71CD